MTIVIKYLDDNNEYYFNSFNEINNYDKVIYINCNNNQLKELPELPNSLQELICYNNQITSLPILPDSLEELDCRNNQIISLPELPDSLEHLFYENNQITSIQKEKYKYLSNIIY